MWLGQQLNLAGREGCKAAVSLHSSLLPTLKPYMCFSCCQHALSTHTWHWVPQGFDAGSTPILIWPLTKHLHSQQPQLFCGYTHTQSPWLTAVSSDLASITCTTLSCPQNTMHTVLPVMCAEGWHIHWWQSPLWAGLHHTCHGCHVDG